ncbi:MAG TPA: type 1 glutamine amidotransferase [Geopsychrobacteraceae bacterium]|nr:type 1 glutamine amidotransferase [Geopsychrobacteraceae bacterium]
MVPKPHVGVTGSARRWAPAWWCTRFAFWLIGAKAIRISVNHPAEESSLAALVIGGGNDISPEHYGGDIGAKVRSDPERDQLEIGWIKFALENQLPLLGICRGAQLINVVLGGSLHEDIRSLRRYTYNRPGLMPTKQVRLEAQSQLSSVCKKTRLRVNSLHHQAIKNPADDLKVVGWDLDQIIQAVESRGKHRIIGVQWHPEYLCYLPSQLKLFRWLLQSVT